MWIEVDSNKDGIKSWVASEHIERCDVNAVPEPLASRLPRYPTVPAVLIGWLGRDQSYSGLGLGEALLFDAIRTVAEAPIGAHAIFADAIDGKAAAFYAAFGFTPLTDRPNTLYLPVATAQRLLSGEAP